MQEQIEADEAIGQLESTRRIAQTLGEQRRTREQVLEALRDGGKDLPFEQRRDALRAAVQRVTVLDDAVLLEMREQGAG
jgi:hypothetical protein